MADILISKAFEYSDEYGGGVNKVIQNNIDLLVRLINKYENKFDYNLIQYRTGGSETSVSILLNKHVIQIYKKSLNLNLRDFFDIALSKPSIVINGNIIKFDDFIVTIYEYGDNYVVMEKVDPLIDTFLKKDIRDSLSLKNNFKILNDIAKGIYIINYIGFSHNDISYDNIGYNIDTLKFKIFDFNQISKQLHQENYERLLISTHIPNILNLWNKWKFILDSYYRKLNSELFIYFTLLLIKYGLDIPMLNKENIDKEI